MLASKTRPIHLHGYSLPVVRELPAIAVAIYRTAPLGASTRALLVHGLIHGLGRPDVVMAFAL